MNKFLKYGCFILLLSCKEKFDENVSNSDVNALIVEGEVNDCPGPYSVELSRSVYFNSNNNVMVSKAEVYVTDDLNNRYDFKEKEAGVYWSDSAHFRGETGRTYTLYINTNDNLSYKSIPCTIGQPGKLDSVFFSDQSDLGLQVNGDISFAPVQNMMTKIDASIALGHSIDSLAITYPGPECVCFSHKITTKYSEINYLGYIPVLKANTDYINGSKIKNIPFFYFSIPKPKMDPKKDHDTKSYYSGSRFILVISLSTLSSEAFNYYNDMINQLNNKNTFFEPTPIQLMGNITCVNNASKPAYGLFQANAIVRKYFRYFDWKKWLMEISKIPEKDIEYIDTTICCGDIISIDHLY